MNRSCRIGLTCVLVLVVSSLPVSAGPDWQELPPDAGSLPGEAQRITTGELREAPLESVSGRLDGPGTGPTDDFEDMYELTILSFDGFSLSTFGDKGGDPEFNTSVWLFSGPDHPRGPGIGLLGNQLCPGCETTGAELMGFATDGSEPMLIDGLTYYVAISGAGNVPLSEDGPIFFFPTFDMDEISGADGEGGDKPIIGWSGAGDFGKYMVALDGTATVPTPEPASLGLLAVGALVLMRRR